MTHLNFYFINIYKIHPGPWTHSLVVTVDTSFRRSAIFDLALSSVALLRVSWKVGFSSHGYPYVFIRVGIYPLWYCLVLQDIISNTLAFRKISRVLLRSWVLLRKSVFSIFGGGSEVVGEFGISFHASWIFLIFSALSALVALFLR